MARNNTAREVLANRPRAKLHVGAGVRPPSYMSRKDLAWELSVSESTVDEMVRRGTIPPPIRLTDGCVRWAWMAVMTPLPVLPGQARVTIPT